MLLSEKCNWDQCLVLRGRCLFTPVSNVTLVGLEAIPLKICGYNSQLSLKTQMARSSMGHFSPMKLLWKRNAPNLSALKIFWRPNILNFILRRFLLLSSKYAIIDQNRACTDPTHCDMFIGLKLFKLD